jgi:hypothetical protein
MTKISGVVFAVFFGLIIATSAAAKVPRGSVRLNVDTNIVNFSIGGWNPAGAEDWRLKKFDVGFGNPNAAVGVGVTLVDALTLGLRLSIGYGKTAVMFDAEDSDLLEEESTTDFDAMRYAYLRWGVSPYLEYAFGEKVVRPFLMLLLGFEGQTENTGYVDTQYWDFVLGLGGGIHLFGGPMVSADLTILFGFSAGGGSFTSAAEDAEPIDFTRVLFRLTGGLGISGWF